MLRHYPKAREVLGCDFRGLEKPEMCKRRPVVVLSYSSARPGLAVVVPLSTTPPNPPRPWHHLLSQASQWCPSSNKWDRCLVLLRECFAHHFHVYAVSAHGTDIVVV